MPQKAEDRNGIFLPQMTPIFADGERQFYRKARKDHKDGKDSAGRRTKKSLAAKMRKRHKTETELFYRK